MKALSRVTQHSAVVCAILGTGGGKIPVQRRFFARRCALADGEGHLITSFSTLRLPQAFATRRPLRPDGVSDFDRLHSRRHDGEVQFLGFDLLELNGADLRGEPLENRKATLASLLRRSRDGIQLSSTSWPPTARPCSSTPVNSASRVSCRSGGTPAISTAARVHGSR
jgi:hypothetical protein